MSSFYALRYRAEVPLLARKHEVTAGRWPTWLSAENARLRLPKAQADLLEVVLRDDGGAA